MSPAPGRVQGPAVPPVGRVWGAWAEAELGRGGACRRRHELPRHVPALVPGRVGQSMCMCACARVCGCARVRALHTLEPARPLPVELPEPDGGQSPPCTHEEKVRGWGEADTCPGFRGAPGLGPPFLGVSRAAPAQCPRPSGAPLAQAAPLPCRAAPSSAAPAARPSPRGRGAGRPPTTWSSVASPTCASSAGTAASRVPTSSAASGAACWRSW